MVEASAEAVPGKPGARMALTNLRNRHGTIGGAGLEIESREASRTNVSQWNKH